MPILVIDDDSSILQLVGVLCAQQGWQIIGVGDGESALEQVVHQDFDAAVCDLELPGMKGQELIAVLSDRYPEIPVVVLTGRGSERAAVECFRAGAADYIAKSDLRDELIPTLQRLIEEEQQAAEDVSHPDALEPRTPAPLASEQPDTEDNLAAGTQQGASSTTIPPLSDEYALQKWGPDQDDSDKLAREGRRISSKRLRVLQRQMDRLAKWSQVGDRAGAERRRHPRANLGKIVMMYPLGPDALPLASEGFETFCRDISASGCSLLHGRAFTSKRWVISLATRGSDTLVSMRCEIVRQRPLPLGMYDIGMRFLERVADPIPG